MGNDMVLHVLIARCLHNERLICADVPTNYQVKSYHIGTRTNHKKDTYIGIADDYLLHKVAFCFLTRLLLHIAVPEIVRLNQNH